MDLISNKIALVTGSTRGIGFEIAKRLSFDGFDIILTSRNKIDLKKFKKYFRNQIYYYRCDFSNENQKKKLILNLSKKFKKLDSIVLNVGYSGDHHKEKENIKKWLKIFNLNFFSSTSIVEYYVKYFKESDNTKITCISSIASKYCSKAPMIYSIAKSALNSYVKIVSKDLAKRKIYINSICPGNILFPGSVWDLKLKKHRLKTTNYIKDNVPLNRFGVPKDIASLVSYLSSEQNSFITGSIINIDGGEDKSL